MALSFPPSPTVGQIYTSGGTSWQWDGTKWVCLGATGTVLKMNIQVFTASGTYTPSAGLQWAIVDCCGGGGGGGAAAATYPAGVGGGGGGGGGAGARTVALFSAAQIGASRAVVIGAGARGGFTSETNAPSGGNTTFGGTLVIAPGGLGGMIFSSANFGYAGGPVAPGSSSGSTSTSAFAGNRGHSGVGSSGGLSWGGHGAAGPYGGGGAGSDAALPSGQGFVGWDASANAYGAGGGGATASSPWGTGENGGAGQAGLCIITEYAF